MTANAGHQLIGWISVGVFVCFISSVKWVFVQHKTKVTHRTLQTLSIFSQRRRCDGYWGLLLTVRRRVVFYFFVFYFSVARALS